MVKEIERKFLVSGSFKHLSYTHQHIVQGFLSSVPERVVRIRIKGEKGFITIKGISNNSGMSRFEWEKEIPYIEARALLNLCEPGVIEKTRYLIKSGSHTWDVDEFHGENEGLVVAEIELGSEDEIFEKPAWIGEEVTGDVKYFNSMLVKNPFCKW